MPSSNTTVAARLPSHLYERFLRRARELGISRSQALIQAIEAWLQGAEVSSSQRDVEGQQVPQAPAPQVPQIIIVIPPTVQGAVPVQFPMNSIPQLSSVSQSNLQMVGSTQPVRKQEEEPFLVVPKTALVEAETRESEAVKAEEASDTQEILSEVESNPWFDILSRKGGGDG